MYRVDTHLRHACLFGCVTSSSSLRCRRLSHAVFEGFRRATGTSGHVALRAHVPNYTSGSEQGCSSDIKNNEKIKQ